MIGTDTVNIVRIKKILEGFTGNTFLRRVLASEGIQRIPCADSPNRQISTARLFAAKESLVKTLAEKLTFDCLDRIQVSSDRGRAWDVRLTGNSSAAAFFLSCSVGCGNVMAIADIARFAAKRFYTAIYIFT